MTTAILVGGIALVLIIAWLMRRPSWRLAALLFGLLAVPGNVDNLLPQMRLDPHDIANATAPVISFVDLLIAWAVVLSVREGRFSGWPRPLWLAIAAAAVVAALAAIVTVVNILQGVDAASAIRGILAFARIPAMLALAFALRDQVGTGRTIAVAGVLAVVALIGNGLYTSSSLETTRFTAATFGRNGFSLVLVVGALVATGLAIELRRGQPERRWEWGITFGIAAAALFAAIATGTRMSLLVGGPAALAALAANRTWWHRRGVFGVATVLLGAVVVSGAAMLWTTEGARALSGLLNPGQTVDIITDPESEPDYSPVRTRTRWWGQALTLARSDPLTGIGPYQWNMRRYELEPDAAPVVADPHNTYIQVATEYGYPVLAGYVGLLIGVVGSVLVLVWRATSVARHSPVAVSLVAAALMIPATEATNSYLFNVRIGPMAWLLLGIAMVVTVVPALTHKPRDAVVSEAADRASSAHSDPIRGL